MHKRSMMNPRPTVALLGALLLLLPAKGLRADLRELNTDRPDATESPFTLDAGHWQVEMDLVSHTGNQLDGVRTREWDVAPFNLRYGLTPGIEAGLFFAPFTRVSSQPRGGSRETVSGSGDLTLRTKINFWGNDGGETAFGLILDVKLPTAQAGLGNGRVEGDFILPVTFEVPGGFELGAMTEVDVRHRDEGGSHLVWVNSATLGHSLFGPVSGYVELASAAGDGPHVATFDFGVAWKLDANTQLDAGAEIGISRTADDLRVFTGLSRRF